MAYTRADLHAADLQIMQAQRNIVRQSALVGRLEDERHSATTARALLVTFDETLVTLQRHRDNIAAALDRLQGEDEAGPKGNRRD
jgi:hypothetical protein